MNKKIDDKLYLRILQLGRENLTEGLKFNFLITTLQQEGYTINNCTNRSIREWFYNSFFHEEAHCQNGNFNNVQELDKHLNCGFVLKADTCMKLLQFEESEKSNKQIEVLTSQTEIYQKQVELLQGQLSLNEQTTKEAKEDSKFARNLAWASILLSIILGLPDWISLKDTTIDQIKNTTTLILPLEQQQIQELQKANQSLDSLLFLYRNQTYNDKINLKSTSLENDKALYNNLKRDKK